MSEPDATDSGNGRWPAHGQLGYLQLPALDVEKSAQFYRAVFGWSVDPGQGGFEAPGMIGQLTTERAPSSSAGPLLWICVDRLWPTLDVVESSGGTVLARPELDDGRRWLVEIDDPAGNRIGLVAPISHAQSQPLVAVSDVEASSRWYQRLLGLTSDHGGAHYERLLSDGVLVLQLHDRDTEHQHGRIGAGDGEPPNGVLLWFGEVADFDDVVSRAQALDARIILPPHRNPPEAEGNGPSHREIWVSDPDGNTVVVASPDGEAYHPAAVAR